MVGAPEPQGRHTRDGGATDNRSGSGARKATGESQRAEKLKAEIC